MIKPVNTPKINGVVCSKTGVKALFYEENTKKRVARHFFTYMDVNKVFISIFNLFKGLLLILENPIYITDRTTKRMIRTNRI